MGCPDDDTSVRVLCECSLDDGEYACLGVLFLVRRGGTSYTSGSSRSTGFEAEVPIASISLRVGGGAQPSGAAEQRIDRNRKLRQKETVNRNGKSRERKYTNYIATH